MVEWIWKILCMRTNAQISAKGGADLPPCSCPCTEELISHSGFKFWFAFTFPTTSFGTYCPQNPRWYLWGNWSHLDLGVCNTHPYMGPWDPFVTSRDLFSRDKGVWDVIVFLQGRCPHLTSWVTTQTPLTHHCLQEHLTCQSNFSLCSPLPQLSVLTYPMILGFGILTEQTCIMTCKADIKSRSPQVQLILTGYLWD